MRFIKGCIVSRIDFKDNDDDALKKYFDFSLYDKIGNSYFLKEEVLNDNVKELREELLELTFGLSDSIENSDAYALDDNALELLNSKIYLLCNNSRYCYGKYKDNVFDTLFDYSYIEGKKFNFYMISVIWDISNIVLEDETFFIVFINNLLQKSLVNVLKGSLWFTITR